MIGTLTHSASRRAVAALPAWRGVLRATTTTRSFGVACKGPNPDPLHLLQQECISRQLCDTEGNRLPGVDWRFAIGVSDPERPGAVRALVVSM